MRAGGSEGLASARVAFQASWDARGSIHGMRMGQSRTGERIRSTGPRGCRVPWAGWPMAYGCHLQARRSECACPTARTGKKRGE